MTDPHALSVDQVRKVFDRPGKAPLVALDNVSLQVEAGKIHGLLGPNGAGKSTLINLMSGVTRPDAGSLSIFGLDVSKDTERAKQFLGVVPQEITMEMAFTVEEVLYYFGGMYGVPVSERKARIDEVLEALQLSDKLKEKARGLSGGMKRRLMIAKAILHRPKLLVLDEPTAGVDVALRQRIWELVRKLNREGTTILFTTHYLEEAEQLCESVTFINQGRVIKEGKVKDIQTEFARSVIHFELFDRKVPHLNGVKPSGNEFEFPMTDLSQDLAKVSTHYKGNIKSIRNEAASLEQIFLELNA